MIDEYLKIAELLDNEYHKRLTVVNELKSKGFSIHSIFLTEFCRFVSYLATADNTISDAEVEFINEYFHVNLNRKQINDLAGTLDETYVKTLPLPAIIYHEIETEVDNNYQLDHVKNFYGILGDLFVSCDGHVDPKEKVKFGIYLKNLRKNVQNLKAGRYGSIDISRKQQNAIKIIEKHKTKNETKNKMTPTDTCSKCGFKNRPTAKFCTQCGNKLI